MTEHATYYERADHCTIPLFEKQQIVIVASEMEKVTIWINKFLFHLRDLSEISRGGGGKGGWKQREGHNFLRLQKREGS